MNIKVLVASFVLVFLAELGDKTQLAALGFAASSRSPLAVFIGTSLALVCSTALAVTLGTLVATHVPHKIVQIVAGVLFVLVGVFLLVNVARRAPDVASETGEAPTNVAATTPIFRTVLSQASAFEEDAAARLREVAACVGRPEGRKILEQIAKEEEQHRAQVLNVLSQPEPDTAGAETDFAGERTPSPPEEFRLAAMPTPLAPDEANEVCRKAVEDLIRAEEAAAAFYLALARFSLVADIRRSLRWLAAQELEHVARLSELYDEMGNPASNAADEEGAGA